MAEAQGLHSVREFWDTGPCGAHFIAQFDDEQEFFARYREFRYRTEWHIPQFAEFARARGKRVLEIGCGAGTDGAMFAAHGADYTGIDLTPQAVDATRRHFASMGVHGEVRQENAERLPFPDASFDIVYSFGVLHHTPDPTVAVREVQRVLRPGGVALVMLYHRHSFNYHVRILGYMRARVIFETLRRRLSHRRHVGAVKDGQPSGVRGNAGDRVWDIHCDNLQRLGWRYLRASDFVHHCTDGPECPYAFTYSRRDAFKLFGGFSSVSTRVAHLPLNKYPGGRFVPRFVERCVAGLFGWHLLIRAIR